MYVPTGDTPRTSSSERSSSSKRSRGSGGKEAEQVNNNNNTSPRPALASTSPSPPHPGPYPAPAGVVSTTSAAGVLDPVLDPVNLAALVNPVTLAAQEAAEGNSDTGGEWTPNAASDRSSNHYESKM